MKLDKGSGLKLDQNKQQQHAYLMLGLTYLGEILLSHIGGKRASVVIRSYRMFVGLWVQIYILTTNPPFLSLSLLSPLEWNLLKITSEDCVEAH